jgi:6-phosphogluconolactonase (cycloisomerase 2 family)
MPPVYNNRFFRVINFAIAGFASFVLMSGFLFKHAEAYEWRNIVYTETNVATNNGNAILAFQENANGKLTPLPHSPFPTGGFGIADPTFTKFLGLALLLADNDQNVIVNPEHTRLFAVNSGSNSIAVFNIKKNGNLSPVPGSPFPSGGVDPESLTLANNFLYVGHENLSSKTPSQDAEDSLPNYTGFTVTSEGQLIPIPDSTVTVPNNSGPAQVLVSPNKKVLFGLEFVGGNIRSFKILSDGRLEQSPNSPQQPPQSEYPSSDVPRLPLGLQVHPKEPILYAGFPTISKVGVYRYDQATGELTFIRAVPNSGQTVCWLITDRSGKYLYTANSLDNSVSVYNIADDPTTPREIQHLVLKGQGAVTEIALNSNESFLEVIGRRNSADILEGDGVHVLKVNQNDGTLTEVDSSPTAIESVNGSVPKGLVSINPRQE